MHRYRDAQMHRCRDAHATEVSTESDINFLDRSFFSKDGTHSWPAEYFSFRVPTDI